MFKFSTLEFSISTILGVIGAFLTDIFGGWNDALTTLVIMMGLDFFTGLFIAGVLKKSPKSECGTISSKVGWTGLFKKGLSLAIIFVGYRLDLIAGTNFIMAAATYSYMFVELVSLTENCGLLGMPLPKAITNAIDLLKGRAEGTNNDA